MDEREFERLLELFPVVRPRDYNAELDSSIQSTSSSASKKVLEDRQDASNNGERKELENQGTDQHDGFWRKLKVTAESKMGAAEADTFCRAFQYVHKKLVSEGLSSDAAQKFLNSQTAEE
ncbi:hypothetical protein COLO4_24933 [Corchorus olitorius]|uniref:Uncharacterized protein n=1 Tax=Corchorus olitorius TaxID=93759 RepID=A0A1R3I5V4_9ROSI|nr:hypothetical protein COLO4_24933 [Corchorus olitorius]